MKKIEEIFGKKAITRSYILGGIAIISFCLILIKGMISNKVYLSVLTIVIIALFVNAMLIINKWLSYKRKNNS